MPVFGFQVSGLRFDVPQDVHVFEFIDPVRHLSPFPGKRRVRIQSHAWYACCERASPAIMALNTDTIP